MTSGEHFNHKLMAVGRPELGKAAAPLPGNDDLKGSGQKRLDTAV
jgi:hypothetical protein